MAETYQSKYTGGQIDAAVRMIGMVPQVFVSYSTYLSSITLINQSVKSATELVDSLNTTVTDWNVKLDKLLQTWDGTSTINQIVNQAIQDEFKTLPYVVYEVLE